MNKTLAFFIVLVFATGCSRAIDRGGIVSRNNVVLDSYDYRNALQVGNGRIAFALDITGTQSFDPQLATLSEWGWHSFPKPAGVEYRDALSEIEVYGRKTVVEEPSVRKLEKPETLPSGLKVEYTYNREYGSDPFIHFPPDLRERKRAAFDYYRMNPHRLYLGQTGLQITLPDGREATLEDIQQARQELDLWTGTVYSTFRVGGEPVNVVTCCHPQQDLMSIRITSPLLAQGRIRIRWQFPYMNENPAKGPDYAPAEKHISTLENQAAGAARIKRVLDGDTYTVALNWDDPAAVMEQSGPHIFTLSPSSGTTEISLGTFYSNEMIPDEVPSFSDAAKASETHWKDFWTSGGFVDFSGSTDPRWQELERRVILSQYATAIQCAGGSPPQEAGLFNNTTWFGKFHLEMTAWHGVHFALWGREHLLENWMEWMLADGMKGARTRAQYQGYEGVRWNKMTDKHTMWESPSLIGAYRLTQQGHVIYLADLLYTLTGDQSVIDKYAGMVYETAAFMADFVNWDEPTGRYVIGPPLQTGAETKQPYKSQNSTVELSYWAYGLETAQKWKELQGLAREKKWDDVLAKLALPPVKDGRYVELESLPDLWAGRPAWLEAYGCMPGVRIDPAIMQNTYLKIAGDYDYWEKGIWGCDFPMLAMTAARLGRPQEAIDWLMYDTERNVYLSNGSNIGGPHPYYPANGGLLWAVAMMCSGWEGSEGDCPGFPKDGSWKVKWEGLHSYK